MPRRKFIKPGEKVGLKLSATERKIVRELLAVDPLFVDRVQQQPAGEAVPFTLDELEELAEHVAAELNYCEDPRQGRLLERIYLRIERLLDTYTDESPQSSTAAAGNSPHTTGGLADWARAMQAMAGAEATANRQVSVKLSRAQRDTLLSLDELDDGIKQKLDLDSNGPRTIRLHVAELFEICFAIAEPVRTSHGRDRQRLLKAAEKITLSIRSFLDESSQPRGGPKAPKPKTKGGLYRLKLELQDVHPPVWRRLLVKECTLDELHTVIQVAMGWHNRQPYWFQCGETWYCDPDSDVAPPGYKDARKMKLGQLVRQQRMRFLYGYDPEDNWRHSVEIEELLKPQSRMKYPSCVGGEGSCPPERIGGPRGYREFLSIINDLEHPRHKPLLDRVGGWFDPDVFDAEFVNRVLRACAS